jgi:hypothetical protein
MKLSIKGLAITSAIIWGSAILIVGIANLVFPGYGINFLEVVGSIYPGYQPGTGFSSVIIGSLYGAVDAGIGAAIFAWLYNLISK